MCVRLRDTGLNGSWELSKPKTSKARRVVTLPASLVKSLSAHRGRQLIERLACGPEWSDLDLVFPNSLGGPLDWRLIVRRYFRPLTKAAELSAFRPYDLRHSCATLLLGAGENVKVVSERLGHASASMTLAVYAHVLPDMQQSAALKLEAMLFREVRA